MLSFISVIWIAVAIPVGAEGRDYSKDLPLIPGGYADVGTHRLHYHCVGQQSPTIVIDNGIAGSSSEWYPIQNSLAAHYRVCVYDRAGYGWSEPGPSPRTTAQIATELYQLLEASGEAPPYVFVGHSFGGFTAVYLGAQHAEITAAVVLVDSSSPDIMFDVESAGRDPLRNPIESTAMADSDNVPANRREMARFLNSRRKALFAQMDEIANFQTSADQVRSAGSLGDLPLLVIAREPQTGASGDAREREWREAQTALTQLSRNGRLEAASGSDHFVHQRRPEWVARIIHEFLSKRVPTERAR